MKPSYLIQRLNKPSTGGPLGPDNPFSFGGGLKNGGMSDEAMQYLRNIFSFDYMGATEFEWGVVPDAFQQIAKNLDLYVTVEIEASSKSGNSKAVYIICPKTDIDEVVSRIKAFAYEEYGKSTPHTKEMVGLQGAIDQKKYSVALGWLELDNGFMFFIEKEMFSKTAELFGIGNK